MSKELTKELRIINERLLCIDKTLEWVHKIQQSQAKDISEHIKRTNELEDRYLHLQLKVCKHIGIALYYLLEIIN